MYFIDNAIFESLPHCIIICLYILHFFKLFDSYPLLSIFATIFHPLSLISVNNMSNIFHLNLVKKKKLK